MALRVNFLFFSIFFLSFPLCITRDTIFYSSTRTTIAVPTSNSLESEESIPTHYLLYVACTPRVASTVHLVLMGTCILRARTSTSNLFVVVCFLRTYEISTDGLSLIEWFLLFTSDFAVKYVVPYLGTTFPLLIRKCVTSHMYCS